MRTGWKTWFLLPWMGFTCFAGSNALLSYAPLGSGIRWSLVLLGLVVPGLILVRGLPLPRQTGRALTRGDWPPLPLWGWSLLFLAAVFLRFYRLLSFAQWPLTDESIFGFTALRLWNHWDFKPFYSSSQVPAAFFWLLALTFKAWGASLFTLWILPEIFSALTLPMVFLATRSFGGGAFALLSAGLWAFSFWPLYQGRFCAEHSLLIFFFWTALWLLGRCLASVPAASRKGRMAVLAVAVAAGFYISVTWILAACALTGSLYFATRQKKDLFGYFLLWAVPLCLPFPVMVLLSFNGGYMHSLLPFQGNFPWTDYGLNVARYVTGIFWGIPTRFAVSSYGPHWGGFLNPLLGAFFFMGALRLWEWRGKSWVRYGLALFPLLSAPAWLTNNLEFFRVVQLSPLVLGVTALGIVRMGEGLSPRAKGWFLVGLVLFSGGLDIYQLFGAASRGATSGMIWTYKSPRFQAYRILEEKVRSRGPGFLFARFMDDPADANLKVACAAFDVLSNPALDPQKAAWVALVTNINRQPFLEKSLPGGKVYWLSKEGTPPDGGWMLFVAPVTPSLGPLLERWHKADEALGALYENPAGSDPAAFLAAYPSFQGDPFLESFFWFQVSRSRLADCISGAYHRSRPGRSWEIPSGSLPEGVKDEPLLAGAIAAAQEAVRRGYPSSDLFYQLGTLWSIAGDGSKARENFLKSTRAPLDFTQARFFLKTLPSSNIPAPSVK